MGTRNEEPAGLGINGVIPGRACVVAECGARTSGLMCPPHWRSVPPGLKDNLRFVMSEWNAGRGTLEDLREAQWACVEAITDDGEEG